MQRTEVSTLGEFGLIHRLTEHVSLQQSTSVLGVGDDAAVIAPPEGESLVLSTDLMLEGIHFDLTYTPLKHLGYKLAIGSFSDIYAMNAQPHQLTVSVGISARFSVEDLEELYSGVALACERYGVDLVGGDTSASLTGLLLSATCTGFAPKDRLTYRSGAKPTHLICVTGDLGAAYMGLQLLERERRVYEGVQEGIEPDFAGREYILERQLKPEARRDVVLRLHEAGILPSSMIDISDGLASELLHIAKESKVGVRIYEDRLPIDFETARMAEELGLNVSMVALNGGEDYELLFTVPLERLEDVRTLGGIAIIGYVTEEHLGSALIGRDGGEVALSAQGWLQAPPVTTSGEES